MESSLERHHLGVLISVCYLKGEAVVFSHREATYKDAVWHEAVLPIQWQPDLARAPGPERHGRLQKLQVDYQIVKITDNGKVGAGYFRGLAPCYSKSEGFFWSFLCWISRSITSISSAKCLPEYCWHECKYICPL